MFGSSRLRIARGALAAVFALPSFITPAVTGTVADAAGTALPNVQIVVAELGRATTSDGAGKFTLRGLPAGSYHLTATLIGYSPAHADVRIVENGEDVKVALVMKQSPLRLSSVVVSATPTGAEGGDLTQSATELSGKALARTLGASVAQTLSSEPGMAMRYNGPAANAPIIRGLGGDRILVLQDGERAGDLSSAAQDHAVSVDPLAAQRIEVVRGPASLLYGNNALGGVVNVISNDIPTSIPGHHEGSISTMAESVNPGGAVNGSLALPLGANWALTMRGGFRKSGDVRTGGGSTLANTQSENWNGTTGLAFVSDKVNGGIVVRAFDFDYGLPSAPGDADGGVHIDGRRSVVSGRVALQTGIKAVPYLRLEGTAQNYQHDEVESDGAIGTSFSLKTQTANLLLNTALGSVEGSVGVQGLLKQYGATGDEALTPGANSSSIGAYLFQELPLVPGAEHDSRVAKLQLGGRYDLYRIESKSGDAKFGAARTLDFNNLSGSIGLSVPLSEYVTVSGSAARAFRAPTVEELFSNAFHAATASYERGTASLKAETSTGLDGIVRVQTSAFTAEFSAYRNRVANFVSPNVQKDTTVDGSTVPLAVYAQSDATLQGVEGRFEARLARSLVAGITGDVVRGTFGSGANVPFLPAARIGGSFRFDDGKWSAGTELRHAFAQTHVSGGDVDIPTAAYTLLNLSAGYQVILGGVVHSVTVRVDNAGDARYFDASSRIKSFAANPGRSVGVVWRVLF